MSGDLVVNGVIPSASSVLAPGLDASRPAASAGIVGQTYYATDTGYTYLCKNATTWVVQIGPPRRVATDANDLLVWTFSEPSGSFANSGSGGAYSLAPQNTIARDPWGFDGPALSTPLSGQGAVVGTGAGPALPATGVTLSVWIRQRTQNAYGQVLGKTYSSTAWANPYTALNIDMGTGSGWRAVVTVAGANHVSTTPTAFTLDVWHHIAFTYDGVNILQYTDGVLVQTTACAGNIDYGSTPGGWELGNVNTALTSAANQPADAWLYDARVAQIARSAAWAAQMYATGVGYEAP